MYKRPIPIVEIRRVVFQEDGVVHRDIAPNVGQQGQNAPIVHEEQVQPQAPEAQQVLRRSTRYIELLRDMFHLLIMSC